MAQSGWLAPIMLIDATEAARPRAINFTRILELLARKDRATFVCAVASEQRDFVFAARRRALARVQLDQSSNPRATPARLVLSVAVLLRFLLLP